MTQRLRSLLGSTPELRPLLSKARALSDLQQHFASIAPPYLAQHCTVLGLQFGTLSIAASNASAAAKLRQMAPELVVLLQNKGCEVSGIRVKVQVAYSPYAPKRAPRKLSTTARDALSRLGTTLADSPLKQALKKLIK